MRRTQRVIEIASLNIKSFLGGTAIPAWAIVLLTGIGMLLLGGGLYALLQKFVVDAADTGEGSNSYTPALQLAN